MLLNRIFKFRRNDITEVTNKLLKNLNVNVTKSTIYSTLEQHPNYPSLLSISDSLLLWNIDNACINMEGVLLNELPVPFISRLKSKSDSFITVTKNNNNKITYFDPKKNSSVTTDYQHFSEDYTGLVLIAQRNENSGELNYDKHRKLEKKQAILNSLMLTFILFLFCYLSNYSGYKMSYWFSALAITSILGCFISLVANHLEMNPTSDYYDRFCEMSKYFNCKKVINNKNKNLFGIFNLSDLI